MKIRILDRFKISTKLHLSFCLILSLLLLVGLGGVLSSKKIAERVAFVKENRYQEALEAIDLVNLSSSIQANIVGAAESSVITPFTKAKADKVLFDEKLASIKKQLARSPETLKKLEAFEASFLRAFDAGAQMVNYSIEQELMELVASRQKYKEQATQLAQLSSDLKDAVSANFYETLGEIGKLASRSGYTGLVISLLALAAGLSLAIAISLNISRPLSKTVAMISELENGRLDNRLHLERSDELGQMADAMDRFADNLQKEVIADLNRLADGDLTFTVNPRDEKDSVRGTLKKLGEDLNGLMAQVRQVGDQIARGSSQVSDASTSLSQGATEQASSLEQITSSMSQMGSQTRLNAENATQANALAAEARNAAENGNLQVQNMVAAMREINESGKNISKIIKVIDEIAFQTNLLALNAAVEAARAGQHGKGFAVVAEEVRNLAARSARAAHETAELIDGSVKKAGTGAEIADHTASALNQITALNAKVSDLVAEIAAASSEQAQGIAQINQGLEQIDKVTQQNTASAEESAAASEQLFSQAEQLRSMLSHFHLKADGAGGTRLQLEETRMQHSPERGWPQSQSSGASLERTPGKNPRAEEVIALDDLEFGKY